MKLIDWVAIIQFITPVHQCSSLQRDEGKAQRESGNFNVCIQSTEAATIHSIFNAQTCMTNMNTIFREIVTHNHEYYTYLRNIIISDVVVRLKYVYVSCLLHIELYRYIYIPIFVFVYQYCTEQ